MSDTLTKSSTKPDASPAKKKTETTSNDVNKKRKPEKSVDAVVREVDSKSSDAKKTQK